MAPATNVNGNGTCHHHTGKGLKALNRADEVSDVCVCFSKILCTAINGMQLLQAVQGLLIPFIRLADEKITDTNERPKNAALMDYHPPQHLAHLLSFQLPVCGLGKEGLLDILSRILQYSVNTWGQGFMDKLCSSTNAVGAASFSNY
jgi:hypothetical protein